MRLPRTAVRSRAGERPRFTALRDTRLLRVVLITTVLSLHMAIVMVGLPLWIVQRTHAPDVIVPLLFVLVERLSTRRSDAHRRSTRLVPGDSLP